MKNYKGIENSEILNEFVYLINNLFYGKEVIKEYISNELTYRLWMGLYDSDIDLPCRETEYLVNRSGLFEKESGSLSRSSYVLKNKTELKSWLDSQKENYLLNEINIGDFEVPIKMLRRVKNLKKLKI